MARMVHHVFTIFNRKPVWLFIDRQDKADDNAEHLFKYAINKNDGVKKYFIIKKIARITTESKIWKGHTIQIF